MASDNVHFVIYLHIGTYGKDYFVEVSKNLFSYRSVNNFLELEE